jgi:hypothetical protein
MKQFVFMGPGGDTRKSLSKAYNGTTTITTVSGAQGSASAS